MSKKQVSDEEVKTKIESKYDASKLRTCIQENMDASVIMENLGIKHRQTLKQHVLKLMSDDKAYYEVKGLYLKNVRRARVDKKSIIKIHLKHFDLKGLEVKENDEFSIIVEGDSLILTKV